MMLRLPVLSDFRRIAGILVALAALMLAPDAHARSLKLSVSPSHVPAGGRVVVGVRGADHRCLLRSPLSAAPVAVGRHATLIVRKSAKPRAITLRLTCGRRRARARLTITRPIAATGGTATATAPRIGSAPAPVDQLIGGGRGAGSYPDGDAVGCGAKYGQYSWCKNDWWISGRGFGYRNCTDFVAWYEGLTWSSFGFPRGVGDAKDWKAYAARAGLTVEAAPTVGDIAWWGSRPGSTYGHVAVVTGVNGDGSVAVDQYNRKGDGNFLHESGTRADAYLHNPANHGAPGGAQPPAGGPSPTGVATQAGVTAGLDGTHFESFVGNDGVLRLSHWTGSAWQTDNFGARVASGSSPSAYLAPGGAHFVYYVGDDGALRIAHWTGSRWQTDDLSQGVLGGTSPSAYLGTDGTHFVAFVGNDGVLRLSHWTGAIWQTDNLSQGVLGGTSPSAYLGPGGTHFILFEGNDHVMRLSHWTGTEWRTDNFGVASRSGSSPSGYVTPDGTHLFAFVGADGALRIAHFTGSAWQIDDLGQGVLAGTSPSAYAGPGGTHFVLLRRHRRQHPPVALDRQRVADRRPGPARARGTAPAPTSARPGRTSCTTSASTGTSACRTGPAPSGRPTTWARGRWQERVRAPTSAEATVFSTPAITLQRLGIAAVPSSGAGRPQRPQPRVDGREVAVAHRSRREEAVAVDAAEVGDLAAAGQARAALALGQVAVAARAAQPLRRRTPCRPAATGSAPRASAVSSRGAPPRSGPSARRRRPRRHRRRSSARRGTPGPPRRPRPAPPARARPSGGAPARRGGARGTSRPPTATPATATAIPSQKCALPIRKCCPRSVVCAWPQTSSPVAPAAAIAGQRGAQRPRLGPRHRRASAPGAAQEVQDREQRDRDHGQMGGRAVQLGEMRHRRRTLRPRT